MEVGGNILIFCCIFAHFSTFCNAADPCPGLPEIMHAFPVDVEDGAEFAMGDIVRYSCMIGYFKDGDGRVRCTKNALNQLAWTTPTFTCEPTLCIRPNAPANGWIKGSVFSFGHLIEYNCRSGYVMYSADGTIRLETPPIRQCLANGEWSGEEPLCKAILCEEPQMPSNGFVLHESTSFGAKLRYTCYYGFKMNGERERSCQENGEWSGEEPTCTAITDDELCHVPDNMPFRRHFLLPGPRLQYECEDGIMKVSYCEDGKWNPPIGQCNTEVIVTDVEGHFSKPVTPDPQNEEEKPKLTFFQKAGNYIKAGWNWFKSKLPKL